MTRFSRLDQIPTAIAGPCYDPAHHAPGIVHIGLGAFVRAHLAVYTDDALAIAGGDWRITCVALRSPEAVETLNAQNGFYSVLTRGAQTTIRVIGSIAHALHAPSAPDAVLAALSDPATRIVSLTITEKGYGISPATGGLDTQRADIAADIASDLSAPQSAVGWIVAALKARRAQGLAPFSVMSCDNLPQNGIILKRLILDFARLKDPLLAEWIDASASFPSTMVDRITPPQTPQTLADAKAALGHEDLAAIETEPFSQWVIEDAFCAGRPAWDQAGAILTADVHPYERMKLRMLNGTHSLLAYCGFLAGHQFVRDTMADPDLAILVDHHMKAAAASLDPIEGIDLDAYRGALLDRFANPAIAHPTAQIAMDGTQKLPPRIFETALDLQHKNGDVSSFAFATAAWIAYARGRREDGGIYDIRDPRQSEISEAIAGVEDTPSSLVYALFTLPGFLPLALALDRYWTRTVEEELTEIMDYGMRGAIKRRAVTIADSL